MIQQRTKNSSQPFKMEIERLYNTTSDEEKKEALICIKYIYEGNFDKVTLPLAFIKKAYPLELKKALQLEYKKEYNQDQK